MLALSATAVRAGEKFPTTDGVKVRFLSLAECRAIALNEARYRSAKLALPRHRTGLWAAPAAQIHALMKYQVWAYSAVDDPEQMVLVPESGKSRLEFERGLHQMLLNVETAYWNLYGSYGNLYSRGQAQRFSFEAWHIVKAQLDAGSRTSRLARPAASRCSGLSVWRPSTPCSTTSKPVLVNRHADGG